MEMVIGAVGLFVEERFAVPGDILWGGVALVGVGGLVALYSPEIIAWLHKITSPRMKAHKVSASPIRVHVSMSEATGTVRRAPWYKRVWRRVLNEIKAWGEG